VASLFGHFLLEQIVICALFEKNFKKTTCSPEQPYCLSRISRDYKPLGAVQNPFNNQFDKKKSTNWIG
jgi:hypothetical protein